jgi:bifunctional UDP-N-acetylglucosamine pyrophosphorylase/glucosamine-1-phosphate N-acetyltransferase
MARQAAVVLAAGKGTRMKSQVPKALHKLCGREMVRLVVGAATDAGLSPTVVVIAPESRAIRDALGDAVRYVVQSDPLGTGHALLQARELLDSVDNVVVLSADVPLTRPQTINSMMQLHLEKAARITLLTATVSNPNSFGRIIRDAAGNVAAVVEDSEADEETREVAEVNAGVYCFRSDWLWPNLESLAPSPGGEVFLTDLVSVASRQGMEIATLDAQEPREVLGVNTRVQLAEAEEALRQRIRERWMLAGASMPDPASVYIDLDAQVGQDTVVMPNTHITGSSRIGRQCEIGPNTIVESSEIGNSCRVVASVIRNSTLEDGVQVGPFGHIRPGSYLESGVRIGSFAEVKKSRLGRGTRSPHFSYIGDAEIGANVNIGAGTVTCNFDGTRKHSTRIEDDAFIGADSMLVAPVTVGARSRTGVGSIVNRDVPPDSVAVGAPARVRSTRRSGDKD